MKRALRTARLIDCMAAIPADGSSRASARMTNDEKAKNIPAMSPCISRIRRRARVDAGQTDGSPYRPRARHPVAQPGAPSVVPVNQNSRLGRMASPHGQGRDMEQTFIGIDVAKDRLDVHVRPNGESFAVARDGEGLAALVERLQALAPTLVVLEATGGYETVVAA